MTVYYTLSGSGGSWNDASTWANASVPDSADDGVILDAPSGGASIEPIYELITTYVTIASLNIFSRNSLDMNVAFLTVAGNVSVEAGGSIFMEGDSIAAGSFINSGTFSGIGGIVASGRVENYGTIISEPFDELVGASGIGISGATFYNTGTISVVDGSRMSIDPGDFLN
jgi:hypothetical protein